jgi:uncharacterized membrane protein
MTYTAPPPPEPGRSTALIVYVLYLLSIPSAAVFALIGFVIALLGRDGAGPLARAHLDDQVRIWWVAFWWGVALLVMCGVGILLTFILIGIPILWLAGLIALIVMIWFTVKSLLGLLKLLDSRPPR